MNHILFATKIIALKEADLQLRERLAREGELGKGYNTEMESLHNYNADILDSIIDGIGYPTISKVGKEASDAAWLVIQHSICRPEFMKKCMALLEEAVIQNEANALNLAYLSDRIAVMQGRPQLYGTQFDWDEAGQLSPQAYDNLSKVNQRRKSVGLNTLAEQTEIIRHQAKSENQLPPEDFEGRKREIEEWRKATGWLK